MRHNNSAFMAVSRRRNDTVVQKTLADCKAHDLDNLYVVDASFFVSCGAVNPSLTVIANALRVADHLRAGMSQPS